MTYKEFNDQILSLSGLDGVDFFTIGYSMLNRPIYCAHIGSYQNSQMIIEASIHAREYITSLVLIEQVKYLKDMMFRGGMYFVLCSNPDGVALVLDGSSSISCLPLRKYIVDVNGGEDFTKYKANANLVDLNVNFDAIWGKGTQNVFCPSPANFVGFYPNSEREVQTLIEFTAKVKPKITLSYHTKGEVIYYGFVTLNEAKLARDLKIANAISSETGYEVVRTSGSVGGYSDYISKVYKVPAFTIEVGSNEIPHPIDPSYLNEIFEKNKDVPLIALRAYENLVMTTKVFELFKNPFLQG